MNLTRRYQRDGAAGAETPRVMAYPGADEGDRDEIRVTRTVASSVVEDGIAYFGDEGQRWLNERHAAWTASGYELVRSGPSRADD